MAKGTGEEHRLLKAAREAVEVAGCDHDLIEQPHAGKLLRKFYCKKCHATIWKDKEKWRR